MSAFDKDLERAKGAKTVEELYERLDMSTVGPEAYYAEIAWKIAEAARPKQVWVIAKRLTSLFTTHVYAVVTGTREEAQAACDNANAWHGEGHPLTPLEVLPHQADLDPRPFPVGKPIESMFDDIDKD